MQRATAALDATSMEERDFQAADGVWVGSVVNKGVSVGETESKAKGVPVGNRVEGAAVVVVVVMGAAVGGQETGA